MVQIQAFCDYLLSTGFHLKKKQACYLSRINLFKLSFDHLSALEMFQKALRPQYFRATEQFDKCLDVDRDILLSGSCVSYC